MKKELIKRKLKEAKKWEGKMTIACGTIAAELQPYFDVEIFVMHQQSDGFVVVIESQERKYAPLNIPVEDVVKTITEDPNFYREPVKA